jgi:hypothetical protein
MQSIHKAQGTDGTDYKYQEPSKNKKGEAEGLFYVKVDKKTGETKLKNADGLMGHLMMKLRGYNKAQERQVISYLKAQFKDGDIEKHTKNIGNGDLSKFKSDITVSAKNFDMAFKNLEQSKSNVEFVANLKK